MGYVYMIENTVNQKKYIGISINEPEKKRIPEHFSGRGNRVLASAIKKYGRDAFAYKILEDSVFDQMLGDLEIAYIAKFNTVAPNGYNLTHGGEINKSISEETRQRLSESHKGQVAWNKGKKMSPEFCQQISERQKGRPAPNKGKKASPETIRKLSESHKGQTPWMKGKRHTAESRKKNAEAHRGKKASPETRQRLSESHKGQVAWNKGKKMSPEFCQQISERQKGRPAPNKGKKASPETIRKLSESHKGQTPWMKGKRHTAESRKKNAEAHRGKKASPETRQKMSESHKKRWAKIPKSERSKGKHTAERKRKIAESCMHPLKKTVYSAYLSLSAKLTMAQKRKHLYQEYPTIGTRTIREWTRKWQSEKTS